MSVRYRIRTKSDWPDGVAMKDPSRCTNVTRDGIPYVRYEVRSGDNNVQGSGSGERCEGLNSAVIYREGDHFWYAWSTILEQFAVVNSSWHEFNQWHNTGTTGGTTSFYGNGDTVYFAVHGGPTVDFNPDLGPVGLFKWKLYTRYDFLVEMLWSSDKAKAIVDVQWREQGGAVQHPVNQQHVANLFSGQGTYSKQGLYRTATNATEAILHNDYRVCTTLAEATAGYPEPWGAVTPPPPPPPPPGPTATELRDRAWVELQQTTVSYPTYKKNLAAGKYPDPLKTHWGAAIDLLGQIK